MNFNKITCKIFGHKTFQEVYVVKCGKFHYQVVREVRCVRCGKTISFQMTEPKRRSTLLQEGWFLEE